MPPEYVDWRTIAETYQKAYNEMATSFYSKLKEAGEQFDVPLEEYFDVDRQILLAQLRDILSEINRK